MRGNRLWEVYGVEGRDYGGEGWKFGVNSDGDVSTTSDSLIANLKITEPYETRQSQAMTSLRCSH